MSRRKWVLVASGVALFLAALALRGGHRATLRLYLPLAVARSPEGQTVTDSRQTVLIIEDHAVTRAGLAAILNDKGYAVSTSPHGRHALQLLHGGLKPNVILLDMLMPEVDGWRFLEEIKGTPFHYISIIVMTGVALSQEWATANGCIDFLRKPFDERDLVESIGRALKAG